MEPGRFRKKTVEIEAMQWDGTPEGATPIIDWVLREGGTATYHSDGYGAILVQMPMPQQTQWCRRYRWNDGAEEPEGDWVILWDGQWSVLPDKVFGDVYEGLQ